jgi:hypothetical protein
VSVPHFAFQFTPCSSATDLANIGAALKNGLTSAEKQLDLKHNNAQPNPDVRLFCSSGVARVAAWLYPVGVLGSWDTNAARESGLFKINLLQAYESFAFRVTRQAIDLLVDLAWEDIPSTYNLSGQADPTGSIHLDDFDVAYYDWFGNVPNLKVVDTRFNGHYSGPFTQTNFYAGVADSMLLGTVPVNGFNIGHISCASTPEWDMETTIESVAAKVFGALHGVDSLVASFTSQGPACAITSMLPQQTLIAGISAKVVFDYQRLNVGVDGITTGGKMPVTYRNPSVTIKGPSPLLAEYGEPAEGTYWIETPDMRPPFTVTWTADGVTETNSSTSRTITWNLGNAKPVSYVSKTISVKVKDADGAEVSASKAFSIKVVWDPSLPPICHIHPYLPQCKINP